MYDWLDAALDEDSSVVVTANLRLTRILRQEYGEQQIRAGRVAWKSPAISAWSYWLRELYDAAATTEDLPTRLGSQQSRIVWERSVRREVDESVVSVAGLAKLARDTWGRMNEWLLDPDDSANAAIGQDQRIFARALQNYRRELEDNDWIDEALLPGLVTDLIQRHRLSLPAHLTLCGFDRLTPAIERFLQVAAGLGVNVDSREHGDPRGDTLLRCATPEAELRAAGAWAAVELQKNPAQRMAVVVIGLDGQADKAARLLREGMTPGWQYGGPSRAAAVNVSYGRPLASYPAIHAALLMLRWQVSPLPGADVSMLLRSPFFGMMPVAGRARLELILRRWPDREWTPEGLLFALRNRDESGDAIDWLSRLERMTTLRESHAEATGPTVWARSFDDILKAWNWPGEAPLNSNDFQLVNRWRDLLNEFSQLELVIPRMVFAEANSRLAALAADTLYQAESDVAVLSVLGPLEAAGLEFDQLWVAGLTAEDWPPSGRPSALISRELQRSRGMPDADPQDTVAYASRVLDRLRSSAAQVHLSFATVAADNEQLPSALVGDLVARETAIDPGWHASGLQERVALRQVTDERASLRDGEMISGGARTINLQRAEPLSAFVAGRLDVSLLMPFTAGIAAHIRGTLIHDALFNLYADSPSQAEILAWKDGAIAKRIATAVDAAFVRHERFADSVLRELFKLERQRTAVLLGRVIEADRTREAFSVGTVERAIEGRLGPVTVSLRCDRIDELPGGDVVILDYKTGMRKRFLRSGEPDDLQLVVYACVARHRVGGLGLFNVDSGFLGIDGVGPALRDSPSWDEDLGRWKNQVFAAADGLAKGDVRIKISQPIADARPLALLSRREELRRDG